MKQTSSKLYLIMPKTALIIAAGIFLLSFLPLTSSRYNYFVTSTFNKISFKFKKLNVAKPPYLIIEATQKKHKTLKEHVLIIQNTLRKIDRLAPSIIIVDSPFPSSYAELLKPWIKKYGGKIIFSNETFPSKRPTTPFSDNMAYFVINQKKNLEVINFVSTNNFQSIGKAAAKEITLSQKKFKGAYNIRYYYDDSMIPKISIEELIMKNLDNNALKGKIIFLKTEALSYFNKPYLTPIGILSADTLLANDINTLLKDKKPFIIKPVYQKLFLFLFLLIFVLIFLKTWLLKAILYSLIIFDLQFLLGYFLYDIYFLNYNYFSFTVYPLIFILILVLISLLNVNKMQDSLKEMGKLKKYLVIQNQAMANMKKLSELGKISSGIYHEINNPLHNILNSLKMLKSETDLTSDAKESLDIALSEIVRLQTLSKSLKGFYRPISDKNERVDILKIIDFSLRLIAPSLKAKNIHVQKSFSQSQIELTANGDKLQQVFLNLLINSVDVMQDNGKIIIEANIKQNFITVKIQDSGPGILPDNRKEIFEAFFTTKGDKGSGLGLFVSYEIINQLGGEITLSEYKQGEGALFTIVLPVY